MFDKRRWDSFQVNILSETEIGKFILCEAREDNTTRLFIHRFNKWVSAVTKNGWWDTFTISTKPCNKGFYICSIQQFRIDRNEYLNCIVFPNRYLGNTIEEDSIAWDYLFRTGKFSKEYKSENWRPRFNIGNLQKKYAVTFKESGYTKIDCFIMDEFMHDKINLEDIASALEEKYDIEKLAEDIIKHQQKYIKDYPLLIKKLPSEDKFGYRYYNPSDVVYFLEDKRLEYNKLKLGEETNMLNRVEAVLKYWDDFYKAKKEREKAERKKKRDEKKLSV